MEEVIAEMERMVLELYTPMTKEEWDSNAEIVDRVLGEVMGE